MLKLDILSKLPIGKMAGQVASKAQKFAPEALTVVGSIGLVATTVVAMKATTRAEFILDTARDRMDKVEQALDEHPDEYSKTDAIKDRSIIYGQAAVSFVKNYAPAVGLGVISITAILAGMGLLKHRNAVLMAAYKGLEQSYRIYREHVIAEVGEEKEYEIRHKAATETRKLEEKQDKETEKRSRLEQKLYPHPNYSQYARFFDESSSQSWTNNAEYNLVFLRQIQNWANDRLHSRGHVFLNEVYEALGLPHSSQGALVGWIADSKVGDNFIDFGLYDEKGQKNKDFINSFERSVLLDFNVDGVIWDLI